MVSWGPIGPEQLHLWPGQRRTLVPRSDVQQASSGFSTGGLRLPEALEIAGLCPCDVCYCSVGQRESGPAQVSPGGWRASPVLGQLQSHSCGHGLAQKGLQWGGLGGADLIGCHVRVPRLGPDLGAQPQGRERSVCGMPLVWMSRVRCAGCSGEKGGGLQGWDGGPMTGPAWVSVRTQVEGGW